MSISSVRFMAIGERVLDPITQVVSAIDFPIPYITAELNKNALDAGTLSITVPARSMNGFMQSRVAALYDAFDSVAQAFVRVQPIIDGNPVPDLWILNHQDCENAASGSAVVNLTGSSCVTRLDDCQVYPRNSAVDVDIDDPDATAPTDWENTDNSTEFIISSYDGPAGQYMTELKNEDATIVGSGTAAYPGKNILSQWTFEFTSANDSNGVSWAQTTQMSFSEGTGYWAILQQLIQAGLCEYRTEWHSDTDTYHLFLYNPGTMGSDKSTGPDPVRFAATCGAIENPVQADLSNFATDLVVKNQRGYKAWVHSNAARASNSGHIIQRFEDGGNLWSEAATNNYARKRMAELAVAKAAFTYRIAIGATNTKKPVFQFDVGDIALCRDHINVHWVTYRIIDWTLTVAATGGNSLQVTTGDHFVDIQFDLYQRAEEVPMGSTRPPGDPTTKPGAGTPNATYSTDDDGNPVWTPPAPAPTSVDYGDVQVGDDGIFINPTGVSVTEAPNIESSFGLIAVDSTFSTISDTYGSGGSDAEDATPTDSGLLGGTSAEGKHLLASLLTVEVPSKPSDPSTSTHVEATLELVLASLMIQVAQLQATLETLSGGSS